MGERRRIASLVVNGLTLLRLVLSFVFVAVLASQYPGTWLYAALFVVIGITDFLDGRLARRWKVQSAAGAWMDIGADFFFIMSSCFVLYLKQSLPSWILMVIFAKMIEFVSTSYILKNKPVFDRVGRCVAVGFYILPILTIVLRQWRIFDIPLVSAMVLLTFGALFSGARRISLCLKHRTRRIEEGL